MQFLNILPIIATFAVAQVLFYTIFNFAFNKINLLNKNVVSSIQIKHILYFLISTFLLFKYTSFYLPYK